MTGLRAAWPARLHQRLSPLLDQVVQLVGGREGLEARCELRVELALGTADLLGVRLDVPGERDKNEDQDKETMSDTAGIGGCCIGDTVHGRKKKLRAPEDLQQGLVHEPVDVLDMVVGLVGSLDLLLRLTRVDALENA